MPENGTTTSDRRPGQRALIDELDEMPAEKVRWLKVRLDDRGHAIVTRAIVLRLATMACMEPDDDQLAGQALVSIARQYLEAEAFRLGMTGGGE